MLFKTFFIFCAFKCCFLVLFLTTLKFFPLCNLGGSFLVLVLEATLRFEHLSGVIGFCILRLFEMNLFDLV